MADWSLIRSTLEGWVEGLTGLPVVWARRPQGWFGRDPEPNRGWIELDIRSVVKVGNDDIVVEYDDTQPAGSEIRTYQVGPRTFTLRINVRTWIEEDDLDALHYASLIRDSMDLPVLTGEALDVANIAVARILSETELDEIREGRTISRIQLDLRMNATSVTEDTTIGYIDTVKDADLEIPEGNIVWTGDLEVG